MSEPQSSTYVPGAMCAKFRIEKLLGKGGMGEVYLAVDTFLGRRVALKVLPFKRSLDPSFRDRMQREAAAGARVEHPNVTKILDGGATDDHVFYVVMELLEGMRTLRALCHRIVLPLDAGLVIAIQIAEGLSAVHAAGIVHRDLKPENVAVLPGGVTKIIDFGLAKVRSEWIRTSFDPSQPQRRMGTAHYMAPEQIDNRKDEIGPGSDVYALGCILFEIFSGGRHVFQRDSEEFPEQMAAVFAHVSKAPPRLDDPEIDREERVPRPLADLVDRCLRKDVRERPEASEIARDLRKILETVKTTPVSSGAPTARTQVPTDALLSRGPDVPNIELPPETRPSDAPPDALGSTDDARDPGPRPLLTPEAWEQRASPPRGFAPVLVTEPLASLARPTLESPAPAPKVGLPKQTIRMQVVAGQPRPTDTGAAFQRGAAAFDAPGEARAGSAQPPIPREVAPELGGAATPAPRGIWGHLWYHRISIAPGFSLPFVLLLVWTIGARFAPVRSSAPKSATPLASVVATASAPPVVEVAPRAASAATPSAAASAAGADLGASDAAPSSSPLAAPSAAPGVSPAGTARSWSGPSRQRQTGAPPGPRYNPERP